MNYRSLISGEVQKPQQTNLVAAEIAIEIDMHSDDTKAEKRKF